MARPERKTIVTLPANLQRLLRHINSLSPNHGFYEHDVLFDGKTYAELAAMISQLINLGLVKDEGPPLFVPLTEIARGEVFRSSDVCHQLLLLDKGKSEVGKPNHPD